QRRDRSSSASAATSTRRCASFIAARRIRSLACSTTKSAASNTRRAQSLRAFESSDALLPARSRSFDEPGSGRARAWKSCVRGQQCLRAGAVGGRARRERYSLVAEASKRLRVRRSQVQREPDQRRREGQSEYVRITEQ